MNDALLADLVAHFSLVLVRVSAFVAGCPFFLPESVAFSARAGVIAVLSLSLSMSLPHLSVPNHPFMALLGEMCVGTALGLTVRCTAIAVELAGDIVDGQIGFGFSKHFNPLMAGEVGPIQSLFHALVTLGFCVSGGFAAVVRGLAQSFHAFPVGAAGYGTVFTETLIDTVGHIFSAGLRIAMPMVLALSVSQMGLALISRVAPQLNLWSLGFAATLTVGLIGCRIFAPFLIDNIHALWQAQASDFVAGMVR